MNNIGAATPGTAWFLNGIENLKQQETETERQLSSGYQIQDASDSPALTPALVSLGSNLAAYQGYQTNLTSVQAEASSADSALGSAVSLIQSAQTLGSEGANTTPNTGTYQTIAQQIQNIQQQLVTIANTSVAGRYIFGGATDQSDPYQYDASNTTTSADKLTAQTPGGVIVNPGGQQVYQGLTAQQIFDDTDSTGNPTANNVFAALQSLNAALTAGSQTGVATALDGLKTAATYLNQQQAYYGASEQRIASEQNSAATEITQLQTQIGNIRDTDVTAAATQLSQEQVDQSAAYGAQAEVSTKTLFDYLG